MKKIRKTWSSTGFNRKTEKFNELLEKSGRKDSGAKPPERKKAVLIGDPDRDRQESAYGYDDEIPDL